MSVSLLPDLTAELRYQASRSGGAGGQHVNKVSSKVEVRFHLAGSVLLSERQKTILLEKLSRSLTIDGDLVVSSQATRSQLQNKALATARLLERLETALKPVRPRTATRPTRASQAARLQSKARHSHKKAGRSQRFREE